VEFGLGGGHDALVDDVRRFLGEHLTPELLARVRRGGTYPDWDFHRALVAKGWMAPGWPVELGGQGRPPLEVLAIAEELQRAGAPMLGLGTTMLVASVLRHLGTAAQKEAVVRPALAGEILIALGFSEPESGSDVAAAQTRAVRDGDEWVVNGQKMFTTNAHEADYAFLLARTDPTLPKHRGLTTFLVPLRQEGVEIRPITTLSGERTNITFYADARVPDALRIGEVNGGWEVMTVGLTYERTSAAGGDSIRLLEAMEDWAVGGTPHGRSADHDERVHEAFGRAATENEVSVLLSRRSAWLDSIGELPGVEGSMAKLFSSEAITRQSAQFIDLLGPEGIRTEEDRGAPARGEVEWAYRFAQGTTIYGGTSEIQRTIIAQRGLGLPRG
jgi:alkylation response protein AidB-like acyl-CoA dehydrogenase